MTIAQALRQAAAAIEATSDTPRLDAELLMAEALGVSRSDLLLRHMGDAVPQGFTPLLERRLEHEPVAYILGHQEFYGLDLEVTPAVLIPRADSETLIEAARTAFGERMPQTILDLGTGSGALLLAALSLWPTAEGLGIDRSMEALLVARRNAGRHARPPIAARFIQRDWTKPAWRAQIGPFDLIFANPPYVEVGATLSPSVRDHEPAGALFAGPDGLDDYRILIPELPALLAAHGIALLEIGATQAEAVAATAAQAGFSAKLHRDLGGRPRALELSPIISLTQ